MANRLYDLFDDLAKAGKDAASSPPRNLEQMTATGSADPDALKIKVDLSKRVLPRVDYSDFSNFVFFNSALDYFNISAERILNEYPYDGAFSDILTFQSESDGYQNFLLNEWPSTSGCAYFSSSATFPYASVSDPLSKIDLSAGEWTIEFQGEFRADVTGSNVVSILQFVDASGTEIYTVAQDKAGLIENSPSTNGGGVSMTTSSYFAITNSQLLNQGKYYAANSSSAVLLAADSSAWPPFSGAIGLLIGSGTLSGYEGNTIPPNFKLRELRIWNVAKTQEELQSNYNNRVYKDDNLLLNLRFTENSGTLFRDYSGNKLHAASTGVMHNDDQLLMMSQAQSDIILDWKHTDVQSFISATQATASVYDRDNTNIITRMVPEQFLILEDEQQTNILRNLLFLLGRQFDELKVAVSQFPRFLVPSYSNTNDTPDPLLEDALKFWGWDAKGSFLSKEAFQYFFGLDVLKGDQADVDNQQLEISLNDIKNQFWRRTLQNLPYIYKRKGTRESVEALLRVYGLNEKTIKLKEFGMKTMSEIETNRINSEKSATSLRVTGTTNVESDPQAVAGDGVFWTQQMQIKFPSPTDTIMTPTLETGSITHIYQNPGYVWQTLPRLLSFQLGGPSGSEGSNIEEFRYSRPLDGTTGSLKWVTIDGDENYSERIWNDVPIFDGRWYSLMVHREVSGTDADVRLHILRLDEDTITSVYDSVGTGTLSASIKEGSITFTVGRHYMGAVSGWTMTSGSEFWVRNLQVWNIEQTENEMHDHALNPFSYGTDSPERELGLAVNWQFDSDKDESVGGALDSAPKFFGTQVVNGNFFIDDAAVPFSSMSYDREVVEYNFIAPPEYGWNEDKIRIISGTTIPKNDVWNENSSLSLEFNLIDSLNEDISLMLSSLENWNNVIGEPANRHRGSYPQLDRLRQQYFSRLSGRINFRLFADFLDFYDRSFVDLIAKLLPAEARFKGAEFVVESHMLERPKVQYTYRRYNPELVPEGRIVIYGHQPTTYTGPTVVAEDGFPLSIPLGF